jgi:hypothetical protein
MRSVERVAGLRAVIRVYSALQAFAGTSFSGRVCGRVECVVCVKFARGDVMDDHKALEKFEAWTKWRRNRSDESRLGDLDAPTTVKLQTSVQTQLPQDEMSKSGEALVCCGGIAS